jgi:prepilin-type N-terminal cleavage/methylation domain-containing protein
MTPPKGEITVKGVLSGVDQGQMGNLSMLRLNDDREAGFTLIELLVVMLILGILAAIALPSFFDQSAKAHDAKAKEAAHDIQLTMETCSTENGGSYTNCKKAQLLKLEPALNAAPSFTAAPAEEDGYKIVVTADTSEDTFTIKRRASGELEYPCTPKATGGCPASKSWKSG